MVKRIQCADCGREMPAGHRGPCPDCGGARRTQVVSVGVATEADVALPVEIAMRLYYSSSHLWASRHFTRLAADIEDRHTGRTRFDIAHRTYVTNAVLSAVCFLEAAVNELYQDATDKHPSYITPLGACSAKQLTSIWPSIARKPTLEKFQLALLASGKQVFDKGRKPYQDAQLVIELRNVLTHFKPETRTAHSLDKKLEKALKAGKFPPNRLMDGR